MNEFTASMYGTAEAAARARMEELPETLREQATEIALEGHNGWGNTMTMAAEEIERLRAEVESVKQSARGHAQEARAQRATVHEIYQLCTGGKGEPGNWNGAEPVRKLVAELADFRRELEGLRQACWDARAILGFDNDGDLTSSALKYPTLAQLVVSDAKLFRADYDEAISK